ncbi:MAG: hypothetical protein NTX64_14340 [Elusimicrobia bacterium]|nr:hypothetical protein [Elusimicrobiota bacterium]
MPTRLNSATSIGRSKRQMPKPPKSAPSNNDTRRGAIWPKAGAPRTSSSLIPWMADASRGMGTPGLTSES